jgi:MSHA biogenesis protein MshP
MPADRNMASRIGQHGFGLLAALFVLVIGGLVAATLVPLLSGGTQANALLLGEQRARVAAQFGTEWARYRIAQTNACAAGTLNLGAAYGALRGFRITIACGSTAHNDGGTPRIAYAINSFAQYAGFGSADYLSSRATRTVVR